MLDSIRLMQALNRTRRGLFSVTLAIVIAALSASGCGMKRDLYLPSPDDSKTEQKK